MNNFYFNYLFLKIIGTFSQIILFGVIDFLSISFCYTSKFRFNLLFVGEGKGPQ